MPTAVPAMVPVHTGVSCSRLLAEHLLWPLRPGGRGSSQPHRAHHKTLRPEDYMGPLPGPETPSGPSRARYTSLSECWGMGQGPGCPRSASGTHSPAPGPWFPAPMPPRPGGKGTDQTGRGRAQRDGPSPVSPQGDRCLMGQQRSFPQKEAHILVRHGPQLHGGTHGPRVPLPGLGLPLVRGPALPPALQVGGGQGGAA